MNGIIIFITRTLSKILSKLGRGSVYPGKIAKKMNPDIMKYFKLPQRVIFVTGTNGKSTISHTLANLYEDAGYKVGNNLKGSNLTLGILTCLIHNSKLNGKSKVDVLVLEIDERYVKYVFKDVLPTHLVINNISRDQPPRQRDFDFIYSEIKKGITDDIHLILNADDPIVRRFAIDHKGKVDYYGLAKNKYSKKEKDIKYDDNLDAIYCPICHSKLKFKYVHYGDVGNYYCPNHDFDRPDPTFESKLISETEFKIDDNIIKMPNHFIYNIYNLSACYTVARLDGISTDVIVRSLNNLKFQRIDLLKYNNKNYYFLISKNENSMSYNQSVDFINKAPGKKSVVIGFERVSRRYNLTDLSWLWDINFEVLDNDDIKEIICVGKYAYDIAVRLKYAIKKTSKIKICLEADDLLDKTSNSAENIYCMFCFELDMKIKEQIKELVK